MIGSLCPGWGSSQDTLDPYTTGEDGVPTTVAEVAAIFGYPDDGATCDLHNETGAAGVREMPSTLVGPGRRPVLLFLLPRLSLILSFQLVEEDRGAADAAIAGNAYSVVGGVVGGVMKSLPEWGVAVSSEYTSSKSVGAVSDRRGDPRRMLNMGRNEALGE